jgi:hypothetical protein
MFDLGNEVLLHGMVFDYLGLIIAVLTIVQLIWNLFAKA